MTSATLRIRSLRQQVAMVLQEPFIFPLSVADNIAYGRPDATRTRSRRRPRRRTPTTSSGGCPEGYDAVVGERGATLSGGEKQRLSIARALLKDAPILILDEPTSALDARTEGLLLDALDRLMRGRTTFVIAHRLSTIRHADRILVLDHGEIVEHAAATPSSWRRTGCTRGSIASRWRSVTSSAPSVRARKSPGDW